METRTSNNWTTLPGYFDRHNLFDIFESDNEFGIPNLKFQNPKLPDNLIPYTVRVRSQVGYSNLGIHFFLDDYRFEQAWIKPEVGIERVKAAEVALTPDFSLFLDMPKAVQIYNTYRNRWLGRFWQERDVKVIPTLSWSDKDSYKFCFLGIPEGMPVAVSTVSVDKTVKTGFLDGFDAAITKIKPETVLCYGKVIPEMLEICDNIRSYRTSFEGLRSIRKKKPAEDSIKENIIYAA